MLNELSVEFGFQFLDLSPQKTKKRNCCLICLKEKDFSQYGKMSKRKCSPRDVWIRRKVMLYIFISSCSIFFREKFERLRVFIIFCCLFLY